MKQYKIVQYIGAYILWLIVLALGLWLIFISRSALLGLAAKYYVEGRFMRQTLVIFLDKSYFFVMGIIWLAVMVITEEYFRKGVGQNQLFRRFSAFAGIELLVIFCSDLILLFLQNWAIDALRLAILQIELIVGLGLVLYWRNRKITQKT